MKTIKELNQYISKINKNKVLRIETKHEVIIIPSNKLIKRKSSRFELGQNESLGNGEISIYGAKYWVPDMHREYNNDKYSHDFNFDLETETCYFYLKDIISIGFVKRFSSNFTHASFKEQLYKFRFLFLYFENEPCVCGSNIIFKKCCLK